MTSQSQILELALLAKSQIYRNKQVVGLLLERKFAHLSNYIYEELRRLVKVNSQFSEIEFSSLYLHYSMDLANLTKFWKFTNK